MTVYIDNMGSLDEIGLITRWSHLLADTDEELDVFAQRLGGFRRGWARYCGTPVAHYGVIGSERRRAIQFGAQPLFLGDAEAFEFIQLRRQSVAGVNAHNAQRGDSPAGSR